MYLLESIILLVIEKNAEYRLISYSYRIDFQVEKRGIALTIKKTTVDDTAHAKTIFQEKSFASTADQKKCTLWGKDYLVPRVFSAFKMAGKTGDKNGFK